MEKQTSQIAIVEPHPPAWLLEFGHQIDLSYALQQLQRYEKCATALGRDDCVQRAIDALERVADAFREGK